MVPGRECGANDVINNFEQSCQISSVATFFDAFTKSTVTFQSSFRNWLFPGYVVSQF